MKYTKIIDKGLDRLVKLGLLDKSKKGYRNTKKVKPFFDNKLQVELLDFMNKAEELKQSEIFKMIGNVVKRLKKELSGYEAYHTEDTRELGIRDGHISRLRGVIGELKELKQKIKGENRI